MIAARRRDCTRRKWLNRRDGCGRVKGSGVTWTSAAEPPANGDRAARARRLAAGRTGEAVDRLVELARGLLRADSAQVSLIADVQIVAGSAGRAAGSTGTESPRADSLCTVTTDLAAPLLVEDAASDERVRHLPPVASGVVGAYLGVPLRSGNEVVGALCVYDGASRSWSREDVDLLADLASPVVAELELAALTREYDDDRLLWQLAVDAAEVGAWDWNLSTGELRWDERLLVIFGTDVDTFGGTIEAFGDFVHPADRALVNRALDRSIAEVGPYAADYRIVRPDGEIRWVRARGRSLPGPDGTASRLVGAAYDTTAEQEAQKRDAQTLQRAAERTALLADVTDALIGTLDLDEAVARLARAVVPELGDWCVVTLADTPDDARGWGWRRQLRDVASWHVDPALRPLVARYSELRIGALLDESFLVRAFHGREPQVVAENAAAQVASVLEPGEARDLAVQLDAGSVAVVPLLGRGRTVGLLSLFRDRGQAPLSPGELDTLIEVAGRAGLALDNARLYAGQRDLAEVLQRSMLTAPPQPDQVAVAVRYESAAEAAQVGGDWYDAFQQDSGITMVAIGDVVGHDTEAAAAMSQVRSLLRGIAVHTGDGPADVLRGVDRAMARLQPDTTATAVVARFEQTAEERDAGVIRVRWSNAGHPPPMIVVTPEGTVDRDWRLGGRPDEAIDALWGDRSDLLLGLDPETPRSETVVTLPAHATVWLYTDGLVERRGQSLDEGLAKLREVLDDLAREELDLEESCEELLRRMLPERPEDDVALVAVRLRP